jgi:hypothetical protein
VAATSTGGAGMTRRTAASAGAINYDTQVIHDYGKDPRGQAMFDALATNLQTGIDGRDGLVYTGDQGAPERTFNGDLGASPQAFTGAAALALYGAAKPIPTGGSATIETAQSIDKLNDLPLRIFAARAARRSS